MEFISSDQMTNGQLVFSETGEWRLIQENWWWRVEFIFTPTSPDSPEISSQIDIGGEKAPYSLWFYVDSKDRGPIMIFGQTTGSP